MWTCNICFKTFDRSTSYYNHRRSHKFNYEISGSEQETSSDEDKLSSNQIFSKKDDVHVCNHDSNVKVEDQMKVMKAKNQMKVMKVKNQVKVMKMRLYLMIHLFLLSNIQFLQPI